MKYSHTQIQYDTLLSRNNDNRNAITNALCKHKTFIVFILLVFSVDAVVSHYLFQMSITFITWLHTHAYYLSPIAKVFSFLATDKFIFITLLLMYNCYSMYTVFILLLAILSSAFCGGALKLMYLSPRPFMFDTAVQPLSCEGGFGNPSNHAVCATCFYLTLYELTLANSERLPPASKLKLKQLTIVLITCICFSRIFLAVHSIDQVLFGCCVGGAVYYCLFHIAQLQHNNAQQVLMLVIYNGKRYITCILVIIAISFIPAVMFDLNKALYVQWNEVLETKCKELPMAKRFEYESYTCILCLSVMISAYLGISYEYYYTFKGDVAKWMRYNFDNNNDNDAYIDVSLLMNDNDNDNTRWNKTNESNLNIKRFCVIILCCGVLMLPHVLISYERSYSIVIVFKILLPLYVVTFLMFSFMKTLCRLCSCTNVRLYIMKEPNDVI